jgi:phenylalanyl-tRNA synthetase alpha chain
MREQLEALRAAAMAELGDGASAEQIEAVRVRVLGRGGELTDVMRHMREVAAEDRPAIGQLVNQIKREVESRIEALQERQRAAALERSLGEARIDVTLPGARVPRGRLHPLTLVMEQMLDIFASMGFEVVATQDVEDDFHNFEALNFPPDHPAREMQDTFFLPGGMLLRTHTSNGQIRVMQQRKPPLAVVCPGNCYRRDELSVRASPMFGQIEGFMVDRTGRVTMAHLKGVLSEFARAFYGPQIAVRFRASFFPFTEPSAELDISCLLCRVCKQSGWTEILGSGMIHPNVLRKVGYDPAEYQGFAFGMGVERQALLKLGVDDMRLFFENDLRFLGQFPSFTARSSATSSSS